TGSRRIGSSYRARGRSGSEIRQESDNAVAAFVDGIRNRRVVRSAWSRLPRALDDRRTYGKSPAAVLSHDVLPCSRCLERETSPPLRGPEGSGLPGTDAAPGSRPGTPRRVLRVLNAEVDVDVQPAHEDLRGLLGVDRIDRARALARDGVVARAGSALA